MLFGKKKSLVGLDIGSHSIKAVELELQSNKSYRLTRLGNLAAAGGSDRRRRDHGSSAGDRRDLEPVRNPRDQVPPGRGRGERPRRRSSRRSTMNKLSAEDAQQAVYWEAEQHVPYDINDVSLDFEILGARAGRSEADAGSARRREEGHGAVVRRI